MSEVLDRLIAEEIREGKQAAMLEGKQEGIIEGTRRGIIETLFSLVHDGLISIEEAAKRADMTTESFTESMKQFNK